MQLTRLDLLLWALSLLAHCVLLAVLLFRGRAATFPVFTTWISSNIVRTVVLFFVHRFGSANAYFYAYWTLAMVDVALQVAVAYELAAHVFRPLGAWEPDARRSFTAVVIASIAIASLLTWLAVPPTRTLRLAIVIRGNFFSSALLSELFVAMIALSVTMAYPWRTHVARLAQGLGAYSLFGIFTEAAHSYFGTNAGKETYTWISHLRIVLYLLCVTYWTGALWLKEPEPRKMPDQLHQELLALQRRTALVLQQIRVLGSAS